MVITFFYIPVGIETEAITLGNLLVTERLVACANVFPIQSIFPWEGRIQSEHEFVLVLKTLPSLKELVRIFLEEKHSYDTPCILNWDVEVNASYGKWVEEQLKSSK